MLINQSVLTDIKTIIAQSKDEAIRAIDHQRTLMYWDIGKPLYLIKNSPKMNLTTIDYISTVSAGVRELYLSKVSIVTGLKKFVKLLKSHDIPLGLASHLRNLRRCFDCA